MIQEIKDFRSSKNIIMACLITGIYDVNRSETLEDDQYELVRNWAESLTSLKLNGLIFHNNFSPETCLKYQNEYVSFVRINYDSSPFSPNVYRYFVYKEFLDRHSGEIENVFVTDISDVVVVNNPFEHPFFIENSGAIFCGDEPKVLENDWMIDHSAHFRQKIANYSRYENKFANETLLNCGIIGGSVSMIRDLFRNLCDIHQRFNFDNQTEYTGDMGAFNYLARTKFNNQLKHGAPVNTLFKGYELERRDCWFRHK